MDSLLRRIVIRGGSEPFDPYAKLEEILRLEWILANGLGGYASGSISGIVTRKYHGFLVAALPPPFGRTVMFNYLTEEVMLADGRRFTMGCSEKENGETHIDGLYYLKEFYLENGLPVWLYEIEGLLIEKRVILIHLQNSVHISYKMVTPGGKVRLKLSPSLHFRSHDAPVSMKITESYQVTAIENRFAISSDPYPSLQMRLYGNNSHFTLNSRLESQYFFRIEKRRGYEFMGDLWKPGYFKVDLSSEEGATLVASTESWEIINALSPQEALLAEQERRKRILLSAWPVARNELAGELVLAADQFVILPASRIGDAAWAHASGNEIRTIIAGYHWFTDWGRDTMISLEGLTLVTGRYAEASWILRTFAYYMRDGLIPNMFPEGEREGLYHTADASVWFFHAVDRYVTITKDRETLRLLLPVLLAILEHHIAGTRFGIRLDPRDGLLRQGAEGYQLTWMDAKVGDWVVTPRRGKAVEINALWYNALRLAEEWTRQEQNEEMAEYLREYAERAYDSFNERFWYEKGKYLYDVIDGEKGEDPACRPNQLLAVSLKYPILEPSRWKAVLKVTQEQLLTPFGLRTLSPDHPQYKTHYDGDLRARDAAYHQGTIWPWLIGVFIDVWLKVYPEDLEGARRFLCEFDAHLSDVAVGSISEIFDAVEPYMARGCIAQAWSVAEVLRCLVKTSPQEKNQREQEGEDIPIL